MKDFLLFQLNDSLFPIGSFAHSFGLESFVQAELIKDENSLFSYLSAYLNGPFLYADLLGLKLTYENANNLEFILNLEQILHASSTPRSLREASIKLGKAFNKACLNLAQNFPFWQNYAKKSQKPNHAISYALFCAEAKISLEMTLKAYIHAQISNLATNALKILPLPQESAIKIIHKLKNEFCELLKKLENLNERHFASCAPHFDLMAMKHEFLEAKLFMS